MGRLAGFRYREIARKLRAGGFQFDRQAAGSHEIWYMPEGTLRAILKQAGIEPEEFLKI